MNVPDLVEAPESLLVSTFVFLDLSLIVGKVDARIGKEGLDPSERGGGGSLGKVEPLLLPTAESSELVCPV